MQPVIRHSFVSFLRNAKPKVSASFHECGELRTWTILKSESLMILEKKKKEKNFLKKGTKCQ